MEKKDNTIALSLAIPLALQHMVAMIVGCITVPLVLGSAAGLGQADLLILMQGSLIAAAVAILLHAFFKRIGSGLPMVVGAGFAFIPTLVSIGSTYGMGAVLGAQMIGALVGVVVGIFFKQIKFLFPPQVTAPVIITVGISLYKTAVGYMAGGKPGDALFGSSLAWGISLFTLAVVIFLANYGKGVFKVSATLFGLIIGYIVAYFFGMVDFSHIANSSWFNVPRPFHFKPEFISSAIVGMVVIFIINTVKEIGVFEAAASTAYNRLAEEKEISGGLIANNISSFLGGLIAGVPNANAAQNVGIVGSSGVTARIVFVLTAVFILITALIPKLSAIFLTIPLPVLGGATIMVFGSIMTTGIRVLVSAGLTNRNIAITGLSVALAVGLSQTAGAFAHTPAVIQALFGGSEIIAVASSAIILNSILPKDK